MVIIARVRRWLVVWRDPLQVYPSEKFPRDRIDPGNVIRFPQDLRSLRVPNVCPYFTFHPFEFVDIHQRTPILSHNRNGLYLFERFRIECLDHVRPLRHDQICPVRGKAPAFALIAEFSQQLKVPKVKDSPDTILPGDHIDLVADHGRALTKVFPGQIPFLQHFTGLKLDLSYCRFATFASALIERSVMEKEPLCKRVPIVWIRLDNLIAVNRYRCRSGFGIICRSNVWLSGISAA